MESKDFRNVRSRDNLINYRFLALLIISSTDRYRHS